MTLLNRIVCELLERFYMRLENNILSEEQAIMAQTICFNEKNNEKLSLMINKYISLADLKTDGIFSATLESFNNEARM